MAIVYRHGTKFMITQYGFMYADDTLVHQQTLTNVGHTVLALMNYTAGLSPKASLCCAVLNFGFQVPSSLCIYLLLVVVVYIAFVCYGT